MAGTRSRFRSAFSSASAPSLGVTVGLVGVGAAVLGACASSNPSSDPGVIEPFVGPIGDDAGAGASLAHRAGLRGDRDRHGGLRRPSRAAPCSCQRTASGPSRPTPTATPSTSSTSPRERGEDRSPQVGRRARPPGRRRCRAHPTSRCGAAAPSSLSTRLPPPSPARQSVCPAPRGVAYDASAYLGVGRARHGRARRTPGRRAAARCTPSSSSATSRRRRGQRRIAERQPVSLGQRAAAEGRRHRGGGATPRSRRRPASRPRSCGAPPRARRARWLPCTRKSRPRT